MGNDEYANATFGEHVRRLRTGNGWSQAALAERVTEAGLPIHAQTILKIEKAQRAASVGEAAVLAQVFGMTLADLVAPVDRALGLGGAGALMLTPGNDALNVMRALGGLSAEVATLRAEVAAVKAKNDG